MIQVQQDRNIRGFTLLELLVVISIVAIVSAMAYPNFSSWKKEREIRSATDEQGEEWTAWEKYEKDKAWIIESTSGNQHNKDDQRTNRSEYPGRKRYFWEGQEVTEEEFKRRQREKRKS